jgi:hypothetical protein
MSTKVIIREEYYNYFGGHKTRTEKYDNLMDGWTRFKKMRSHVFTYDDAWYRVYISLCVPVREDKPQRVHARSEWEWQNMEAENEYRDVCGFTEAERNYLINLAFDVDNEDIII